MLSKMVESDASTSTSTEADANIRSALSSLSIMDKICTETIDNFRTDLADIANDNRRSSSSAGGGGGGTSSSSAAAKGGVLPMPGIDEEEEDGTGDGRDGRDARRGGLSRSASVASFSTLNSGGASSSRLHTVVLSDFVDTLRTARDELKLFRSALHLLMNAARHAPAASSSSLSSSDSYIWMRIYVKKLGQSKSMLMFECRDTGTGVDSEQRQKLCSPFSTDLNSASLPTHDQPGLGLCSVAINVSSLGGRCGHRPRKEESWDSAAKDQPTGSIFWFAVPLSISYSPEEAPSTTETSASSSPKASDSPSSGSEKRKMISVQDSDKCDAKEVYEAVSKAMEDGNDAAVAAGEESLVPIKGSGPDSGSDTKRALEIDDSVVIRKSIGRALANLGFQVTYASDGMQGLQALQSSKFDVVFCDFLMPVLDGLDCIEQHRTWESKHRPDFHQKIVGLSAHAGKEDINRGKKAGMDTFVSKNSKLKDMLNREPLP